MQAASAHVPYNITQCIYETGEVHIDRTVRTKTHQHRTPKTSCKYKRIRSNITTHNIINGSYRVLHRNKSTAHNSRSRVLEVSVLAPIEADRRYIFLIAVPPGSPLYISTYMRRYICYSFHTLHGPKEANVGLRRIRTPKPCKSHHSP